MFFASHNLALRAEWQKLKRSGIFWICFGASIFIPLLITTVILFVDIKDPGNGENRWDAFIENCFGAFTMFFFPVFLVLMVVRLVYVEHRSDTWKLMETQPVSRLALYLSKWEVAVLLSFICLLSLLSFSLFGGFLVQSFKKSYGLHEHSITWSKALSALLRFWISGLGIISIQYWLGLMIRSFAWPMIIGVMGTIVAGILKGFGVASWWPYMAPTLTAVTYDGALSGGFLLFHEKLSIVVSLFFLWIGYRYYVSKSMQHAFFRNFKTAAALAAVLIVFIAASVYINRPAQLSRWNRTVLAGSVSSSKPVASVVLMRPASFDTVALIPVVNGRFHQNIKHDLLPGMYYLQIGPLKREVFFGNNDSMYVKATIEDKKKESKILGTRLAENQFIEQRKGESGNWELSYFAYTFTPEEYALECYDGWRSKVKEMRNFKTADNIQPAEDFLQMQEKLAQVSYLELMDIDFPNIFRVYHPNEAMKYPAVAERLRKDYSPNRKELASFEPYRTFVISKLLEESGRDKAALVGRMRQQISDPVVRDAVAFDVVENQIMGIRDSVKKSLLLDEALSMISDNQLKSILNAKIERLKNLKRNSKAPLFAAEGINKLPYTLESLAGRYVVIDLWATWCGPCKKEAPFFEELADRFTSEEIAFVSISLDSDMNAWKSEVAGDKSKILQLWAPNGIQEFGKNYAVSTIPRYILISPKGTIINAEMPPPSDPEFETILQREIASLGNRSL